MSMPEFIRDVAGYVAMLEDKGNTVISVYCALAGTLEVRIHVNPEPVGLVLDDANGSKSGGSIYWTLELGPGISVTWITNGSEAVRWADR